MTASENEIERDSGGTREHEQEQDLEQVSSAQEKGKVATLVDDGNENNEWNLCALL